MTFMQSVCMSVHLRVQHMQISPWHAYDIICETKQRREKYFFSYPTTPWSAKVVINLGLSKPTEQFRRLVTPM